MGVTDRMSCWVVELSSRLLPSDRANWALAMRAEHGEALNAGGAMSFAFGCLVAASRAHLIRPGDRSAMGRSALVIATVVPLAIFHFGCAYGSSRFALGAPDHFHTALLTGTEVQRRTAVGYKATAPLFGALLLVLATSHLVAAWHLIGWRVRPLLAAMGVALLTSFGLAATIVSVMANWDGVAVQFTGLGVETILLASFAASAGHGLPRRSGMATRGVGL